MLQDNIFHYFIYTEQKLHTLFTTLILLDKIPVTNKTPIILDPLLRII